MARRRTTRRRSRKAQLVLDKHRVSLILVALGGFYFFAMSFAPDSPLMNFFHTNASYLIGDFGVNIFFMLCILAGLVIRFNGERMRTIVKGFFGAILLISSVLNFPLMESQSIQYEQFGGYISRPILFVLDELFGGSVSATKAMIVLFSLIFVAWLWYIFRIPLPSLKISVPRDTVSRKKTSRAVTIKKQPSTGSFRARGTEVNKEGSLMGSLFGGSKKGADTQDKKLLKQVVKSRVANRLKQVEEKKELMKINFPTDKPTFRAAILDSGASSKAGMDSSYLVQKAKNLQQKLLEFNVPISIEGFDIGPSIVQIRVRPEAGIKVSAIENLKNDVALSLKSKALRIISPVPGTDCIGIQLPNPQPQMVHLGDILQSNEFLGSMKKNLTNIAMGKAIDGSIVVKSLEKMPHLLIAGATGSGKSVGVNDFVLSLMYQNSPSELKFLMVDPKQVEMEMYSGLPYLLAPIVTQPDKALRLLKWAVEEMEVRYKLLKTNRVKNLVEYNNKHKKDKLYRIVVVIDELADLMMSGNKKEVENCITRIAQKARAVGIHLIVATQRPSVNVITGLIKANMPTRIAFGVVSQIDSRTILGVKGAEDLVGRGDFLYIDTTTKYPVRLQAPFVDTHEIESVVGALKAKYMDGLTEDDIYHPELMAVLDGKKNISVSFGSGGGKGGSDEDLAEQAIEIIRKRGKASATMLQRTLNVGFARAARIMDMLEERGVVGPQDGAKAREIMI